MSLDWCPGIREACAYWHDAPMLQQTFEALEGTLDQDNDACIDCSKAMVEVFCQTIVASFHSETNLIRPEKSNPTLSDWLASAVRALRLGDVRDVKFRKLISSHSKLADALNDLRNEAGPVSHGKEPYLARLAMHHRRSAVLATDAIVAFLHTAYLDSQLDPKSSREPWERFESENKLIDSYVNLMVEDDEQGVILRFIFPDGDEFEHRTQVSQLLYQLDREAYIAGLNAAHATFIANQEVAADVPQNVEQ